MQIMVSASVVVRRTHLGCHLVPLQPCQHLLFHGCLILALQLQYGGLILGEVGLQV
jgi:hypothetical protein